MIGVRGGTRIRDCSTHATHECSCAETNVECTRPSSTPDTCSPPHIPRRVRLPHSRTSANSDRRTNTRLTSTHIAFKRTVNAGLLPSVRQRGTTAPPPDNDSVRIPHPWAPTRTDCGSSSPRRVVVGGRALDRQGRASGTAWRTVDSPQVQCGQCRAASPEWWHRAALPIGGG
jgi:hypothetical protein